VDVGAWPLASRCSSPIRLHCRAHKLLRRSRQPSSARLRPRGRLWPSARGFSSGPPVRTVRSSSRHRVLKTPARDRRDIRCTVVELERVASRIDPWNDVARRRCPPRPSKRSHRTPRFTTRRSMKARAEATVVVLHEVAAKCFAQRQSRLGSREPTMVALVWSCPTRLASPGVGDIWNGRHRPWVASGSIGVDLPARTIAWSCDGLRSEYPGLLAGRSSTASPNMPSPRRSSRRRSNTAGSRPGTIRQAHRLSARRRRARALPPPAGCVPVSVGCITHGA